MMSVSGCAVTTHTSPSPSAARSTSRRRYCTGYLSDVGTPKPYPPGDFAAYMEVYLGGQWMTFDPRNNVPRIGRILIAEAGMQQTSRWSRHSVRTHLRTSAFGPTRSDAQPIRPHSEVIASALSGNNRTDLLKWASAGCDPLSKFSRA